MHLSMSWSWIIGAIAALIVIASLAGSRRRRAAAEVPEVPLDDSGTFPVLTPPEDPAEILTPPEAVERPVVSLNDVALDDVPVAEPPAVAANDLPQEDELDEELDDALDRVVK